MRTLVLLFTAFFLQISFVNCQGKQKFDEIKDKLKIEIEKDTKSKEKLRSTAINIASYYAQIGDKENSYKWLDEAYNRGLIKINYLADTTFNILRGEDRFNELMAKLKDRIGLDKPAKSFSVKTIKNNDISIDFFKGKVILLDFWATWCKPCRASMPKLKGLYNKYNLRGFEIIGISADKDIDDVIDFVEEEKIKWHISCSEKAQNDEVIKLYGVNYFPSYFLIDKKGIVRYFDLPVDELIKQIESLLNE